MPFAVWVSLARGNAEPAYDDDGQAMLGAPPPDALFTVGLPSQLDLLPRMPLTTALAPLRPSDAACEALLEGRGPWADLLALALAAAEGDDEVHFAALAAPYGGTAAVLAEAERARAWAAGLVGARGSPG